MKTVQKKKMRKDNNSIEEQYGCTKQTVNNFYFKNRMQGYGVNLKLHIFKIKNNDLSLRDVIENMLPELDNERNKFKMKAYLRLPKDEIISGPNLYDENNKYRLDFLTTTDCNINLCNSFKHSVIRIFKFYKLKMILIKLLIKLIVMGQSTKILKIKIERNLKLSIFILRI